MDNNNPLKLPWKRTENVGSYIQKYQIKNCENIVVTDLIQLESYPPNHALDLADAIVKTMNQTQEVKNEPTRR